MFTNISLTWSIISAGRFLSEGTPMDEVRKNDDALFEALNKAKRRKRRRRWITVLVILAIVAGGILYAVNVLRRRVEASMATEGDEVLTYDASIGSISTRVSGSGTIEDVDTEKVTVPEGVEIDEVIKNHEAIMDLYDPNHRIDLLLDEWGTWFDVEPGTNPGHLYQQNSMRDAMVAAMTLNIFNKHTSRLKMANIAQMVNVLQAMILTKGSEIVLTPTYHVFRMYNVHQDATAVPVAFATDSLSTTSGRLYPTLSVSASKKENLHVSLANPSVDESKTVELEFDSLKPSKVSGEVLIGKGKGIEAVKSYNDFEGKSVVAPAPFKDFKTSGKTLKVTLPPASVVVLEIK